MLEAAHYGFLEWDVMETGTEEPGGAFADALLAAGPPGRRESHCSVGGFHWQKICRPTKQRREAKAACHSGVSTNLTAADKIQKDLHKTGGADEDKFQRNACSGVLWH